MQFIKEGNIDANVILCFLKNLNHIHFTRLTMSDQYFQIWPIHLMIFPMKQPKEMTFRPTRSVHISVHTTPMNGFCYSITIAKALQNIKRNIVFNKGKMIPMRVARKRAEAEMLLSWCIWKMIYMLPASFLFKDGIIRNNWFFLFHAKATISCHFNAHILWSLSYNKIMNLIIVVHNVCKMGEIIAVKPKCWFSI